MGEPILPLPVLILVWTFSYLVVFIAIMITIFSILALRDYVKKRK